MPREFAEFHDELRSVASDLLAKDRSIEWPVLAEVGWTGLEVPDDFGGAGATFREVAIICEELGRAATRSAHLGGAVLSVGALMSLQPSGARDKLLTDVASGAVRTAVALNGPFELEVAGGGLRLSGRAEFVPDAEGADRLLVIAIDPGGTPVVVDTPALTVTEQPVLDETRRLAAVSADGVAVEESSVWPFAGDPERAMCRLRDRASVAIASDSLGLSEAMLAATISYAKVRHQFGRPIGSFQAVKHACADMLVQIAVSRQLVSAASEAVAEDRADADVPAAMAKSYATTAAVDVVGKAMQLHGGIGYTWEGGIHIYLKRAALNRSLFGSPAAHRRELAKRYL